MDEHPTPLPAPPALGAVVLAAGGSSRMGTAKQLLPINGAALIVRTVEAVIAAQINPVVVVLGHSAEKVRTALVALPVKCIENTSWADGIGSSIRLGIQTLNSTAQNVTGGLITLGDQPLLSAAAIRRLIAAFHGPQSLVASRYGGVAGAPVIFGRAYFSELLALPSESGARQLLRTHASKVVSVDLPELEVDLDTPEDYQRFLATQNRA